MVFQALSRAANILFYPAKKGKVLPIHILQDQVMTSRKYSVSEIIIRNTSVEHGACIALHSVSNDTLVHVRVRWC